MPNLRQTVLALIAISFLVLVVPIDIRADEADDQETLNVYSSPQMVFDVFRTAHNNRQWRTLFLCLTPDARDAAMLEARLACGVVAEHPEVLDVLREYGVDDESIDAEYSRRYLEKYGKDQGGPKSDQKGSRGREARSGRTGKDTETPERNGGTPNPGPPDSVDVPFLRIDNDLLRDVVCSIVSDKAGFFEAAMDLTADKEWQDAIGRLRSLSVDGEAAVGRGTKTVYHLESVRNTAAPRKVLESADFDIHFRRIGKGWLVESVE